MSCETDNYDAIRRNLADAGCPDDTIEQFITCLREGRVCEQKRILARQRCELLESLHENQKKLDCLDYLIYRLKEKCCKGRS